MIYLPILGAVALAGGTILQKIVLRKKKISVGLYHSSEFFALTLVMLPFIYFFWHLEQQALTLANIFIFALVLFFSVLANVLTIYSMKWERVSNLEPAKLLEPLFVIILAIIFSYFFGEVLFEKNNKIVIPALIAGAALVFSHIKKHHLDFNKYFTSAIFGSFFFALELVISQLILNYYSSITFYFLRCSSMFLISLVLFRPKFSKIDKKTRYKILAIGFIWAVYRIILYYGYTHLGVIFTTLIIMLGPIFIYSFAWKFLKEKINWRNIIAALIIIGCVLYATIS